LIYLLFFILFSFEEKNPAILYLKSQIALDEENYKKAGEYLEKALEANNSSPFLKLELAKVLSYEEKFQEALKVLENFSPPDNLLQNYYSLKFYLYLMLNDIEDALKAYEKIKEMKISKENLSFLVEAIQKNLLKYLSEEKPDNSIKLLQIYSKYFPKEIKIQEALINLYIETGNLEEIKKILNTMEINENTYPIIINLFSYLLQKNDCSSILNLSSSFKDLNNEDLLSILSYCLLKSGEIEDAKNIIQKILSLNPNNFDALRVLLEIKIIEGEYKEAEGLIKLMPKEKEEQVNYIRESEGVLFQIQGRYKEAEDIYLKLLGKFESKEKIKILRKIYYFYKGIGDCFKALEYAYKLLDEDPEDVFSYYRLAEAYLILKDIENGLFFLNIYKEKGEKGAIIDVIWLLLEYNYLNEADVFIEELGSYEKELEQKNQILGFYYFKKGNLQKMEEVLKRDGENPSSLNLLGYFLIEKDQRIDEAINFIEKALKSEPNNGSFLDSLGWGYYKKGDLEKAYYFLKKANFLEPYNGTILSHLGDVCLKSGKYSEALLRYKQALSFQVPDMPDVLKKIEDLLKKYPYEGLSQF